MNKKIAIFSPFLNPVGVKEATFGLSKKFSENNFSVDLLSVHKDIHNKQWICELEVMKLQKSKK